MYAVRSENLLIETLIIVNLLASPKLCTPVVKIPPEPLQKKPGPPASSQNAKKKKRVKLNKCLKIRDYVEEKEVR